MPDEPTTADPTPTRRGAFAAYLDRHPILAAVVVLLPVLVTAYLDLRSGLSGVREDQQTLANQETEAVEIAGEVETKAGQLEQATRQSKDQIVAELQRQRESVSAELGTVYSDVARLSKAVERLSVRLALIEEETIDPDTRLRNEARILFPTLDVEGMDPEILQRLVDIFHGNVEARLPPRREKPRVDPVALPAQDPVFDAP